MFIKIKTKKSVQSLLFSLLFFCSGTFTPLTQSKIVVWDLGYVCFETSTWGILKEIGLWNVILYGGNPLPATFRALESVWGLQVPDDNCPAACHCAEPLSQAMCNWQKGTLSGTEIINKLCEKIDNNELDHILSSNREKRVTKALTSSMFDSKILAKHMHPIDEGVKLLERCDTEENTMVILSNFDPKSFEELYNKSESKPIFDHFRPENIIISGHIGMIKPYNSIYDKLKERLIELDERFADPEFMQKECIFLDDQQENVEAAIANGIPAVQVENLNYKKARQILQERDFIN